MTGNDRDELVELMSRYAGIPDTGWTATHRAITDHQIAVDGDRACVRAHVRVGHRAPPEVETDGPSCWLVVGSYDDVAVRTPEGCASAGSS